MMLTQPGEKSLKGLLLAALSKSAVDYRENCQFTGGFCQNRDTWFLQESFLWEDTDLNVVSFCSDLRSHSASDSESLCILKGGLVEEPSQLLYFFQVAEFPWDR